MKKTLLLPFALILSLLIVLFFIYSNFFYKETNLFHAHGTVDIKDSLLSFERSGKIIVLNVDEGQKVKKGDILARLDDRSLNHQLKIQFAQCDAEQALLSQYQHGYLKEELDSARASVDKAQATVNFAAITFERNASLVKTKSASRQEYDSAKASYEEAKASLKEAQSKLALLEKGYREEIINAQLAKVAACNAQLSFLNYQINNQGVITAPFSGTIRSRLHEISDYVGAGETIFALTDEQHKSIRIYLSEAQLALIKEGSLVEILLTPKANITRSNKDNTTATSLDSNSSNQEALKPSKPAPLNPNTILAKVAFISPTAMFTPKTVQTEDLRADLIYEVRIDVNDQEQRLRFGQSITVNLKP